MPAGGEGRATNEEGADKTEMEEEGEGNNADAVIGEGHNNRATNTTALQMLKTRYLVVCVSFFVIDLLWPLTLLPPPRFDLSRSLVLSKGFRKV